MTINTKFDYEFHTIILAGGRGSRMNHLLNGKPKCSLPVANKPLIQYTLEMLKRHNILDAYIVVLENEENQIKNLIASIGIDIKLKYVTIPHTGDFATADSLRTLHQHEKLTKDILLISCDIIGNFDLNQFIQLYRLRDSTFLCAFSSQTCTKEDLLPATKLPNINKEFDYIGLDGNDNNHLVFCEPDVMFIDSIPLKRSLLESCPQFQMHTDLIDSHVYLFRNWILDYLQHETNIRSIKFDLLPSLVRKQFRRKNPNTEANIIDDNDEQQSKNSKKIINYIRKTKLETYMDEINLVDEENSLTKYPIECHAFIVDSLLTRVNNLFGYCQANRFLIDQKFSQTKHQSIIGNNFKSGEKNTMKHTIIGSNCHIGNECQLINCLIQDNVSIDNNCTIINSIICSDAKIDKQVTIENCLVGQKYHVIEQTRHRNELLVQEMLDLI